MVEGGKRVEPDDPSLLLTQADKLLNSIKEASKLDNSVSFQELGYSRQKLRDIYRTLLLENLEVSLDKKIEQELWNQCYKNPITFLQEQQKLKTSRPELRQEAAHNLTELLEGAYGFYLRLLDEICEVYSLEVPNRASDKQLKMINTIVTTKQAKIETPRLASSKYIAQHCLVHLGDIARYRHKTNMADSYYRKAAYLVPSNGQPYNQLAILASGQSDMLSTVFFYLRAIYVKCPFPGSKTNLERTLDKVLKVSKNQKSNQKQINKISVLELIRLFLKFHAVIYTGSVDRINDPEFEERYVRLIGAIEVHLSVGGLSRRQLLQITFISIVNLHKSTLESNKTHFGVSYSSKYLLTLLDLLIRPPVEPVRHLPSVLLILQFIDQNPDIFKDNKSPVWPHLSIMLNRTLPPDWSKNWKPKNNPLPEDIEFKGWSLWRLPTCVDITKSVASESEQTDSRAERILEICRKIASDDAFSSLLRISFPSPTNINATSQFMSPVVVENDTFDKKQLPQRLEEQPPMVMPPVNYPVDPSVPPPMVPPPVIMPPLLNSSCPPPQPLLPPPLLPSRGPNPSVPGPLFKVPDGPPPNFPMMPPGPPPVVQNPTSVPPPPIPPGVPPPDVLRNLPPELLNILRHIPPPSISSSNLPEFPPRFPSNNQNTFNQNPATNQRQVPTLQPPKPQSLQPLLQSNTSRFAGGDMNHNQQPLNQQSSFDFPYQSYPPQSPNFDKNSLSKADSNLNESNRNSDGIGLDQSSCLNSISPIWNRAPGPNRSPNANNTTNHEMNRRYPPIRPGYDSPFFRADSPMNSPHPFLSHQPTKPVLDPDSYDRKIESVSSQLWDPKSPRGIPNATSRSEIWAPIRPQSPLNTVPTPLETMTEKFLESLPND